MTYSRAGWTIPPIHAPQYRLIADAVDWFCHGYQPGDGDTVVDIGAGLGTELVAFSRMVGRRGHVIGLEAHPTSHAVAERLRRLNRLDNVQLFQLAAWSEAGFSDIEPEAFAGSNSMISVPSASRGTRVPTIRLDDLLPEATTPRVALLKMNIEGAEVAALRGAAALLARTAHVAISCHDFVADQGGAEALRTRDSVEKILVSAGFRLTRRLDDPRDFVRDYWYGSREAP